LRGYEDGTVLEGWRYPFYAFIFLLNSVRILRYLPLIESFKDIHSDSVGVPEMVPAELQLIPADPFFLGYLFNPVTFGWMLSELRLGQRVERRRISLLPYVK
jgi:hypothetical protein